MGSSYAIFASARSTCAAREFAALLQHSLSDLGREVVLEWDKPPTAEAGRISIVVDPNEYFSLLGLTEVERYRALSASVSVTTKQLSPSDVAPAQWCFYCSPLTLAISRRTAKVLRARGIRAEHLQLGYHKTLDKWGGDLLNKRPRDVSCIGAATGRRANRLAEMAGSLSAFSCDLRLFETGASDNPGDNWPAEGERYSLLAGSKVSLNIHSRDVECFEWGQLMAALANGSVVITETSIDYEPLVPFDHFIQAPSSLLAEYATAVLVNDSWRQEIASDAYEFVRRKLDFVALLERKLQIVESIGGDALTGRHGRSPARAGGLSVTVGRHHNPEPGSHTESPSRQERAEGLVHQVLMSEIVLRRTIDGVGAALTTGSSTFEQREETRSYRRIRPDLSVVITVRNHGQVIEEAISSILRSTTTRFELIVVDDHSTDGSVSVVQRLMRNFDWLPSLLVRRHAVGGGAAARNLGIGLSRSDYVFVSDASTTVFPRALEKLESALNRSDAAFSYGLIDRMDPSHRIGSISPWNPERLVRGPYIEDVALLRRSVWERVGGYDQTELALVDWEHHDFWLRLASEGLRGEFLPEFVARRKGREGSTFADLDERGRLATLRSRHPVLSWQSE